MLPESSIDPKDIQERKELLSDHPFQYNYAVNTIPYVMMPDTTNPLTSKTNEEPNINSRFKRSPTFYRYRYPYPYSYPSYSYSCYNCYPPRRPGRVAGAAVVVGGAAFTGGFIGGRLGRRG